MRRHLSYDAVEKRVRNSQLGDRSFGCRAHVGHLTPPSYVEQLLAMVFQRWDRLGADGTLNLLHRVYGRIAPGLRRVCIGTNILMTIFAVLSGVVAHASIAGFTLVLGLIGGATALSLSRRALVQPAEFTR